MRNFGFHGYDNVIYIGTNGKMTEVCAAMGLTSLESIDQFIATNRRNYSAYRRELDGIPGLSVMAYDERERANYQYIVLEVDERTAGLTRDELVDVLFAENVLARRYFFPGCHRMEPYRSYFPHAALILPETERLCHRVMLLPTGTSVDETAVLQICKIIRTALSIAPAVRGQVESLEAHHRTNYSSAARTKAG
jgi:dTDP-4-amino-4,6-dideoxygalactose transaminase